MRALGRMLSLCLLLAPSYGEGLPPVLETKVTEAAPFKNGLALVVREGRIPAAGEYLLLGLPTAVHGSFWLQPSDGVKIASATACLVARPGAREAYSMLDLLRANVGREVEVQTQDGWLKGTLASVPAKPVDSPLPVAPTSSGRYDGGAYRPPRVAREPAEAPGFVLLDTADGRTALAPGRILAVKGKELATVTSGEPAAAIRVKLTGAGTLRLTYLVFGLTWAPSYRVEVLDGDQAKVSLKATLLNDVEDLNDSTVRFITGYPNLRFATTPDPMGLMGDVSDFLASLQPRRFPWQQPVVAQNMMVQMQDYGFAGVPAGAAEEPPAPSGERAGDLFFYSLPGCTLPAGQRGYYPLLETAGPCWDRYEWDIADALDRWDRWQPWWQQNRGEDRGQTPEIWHVLKLKNTGQIPWTTAPALVLSGGRILGQDTIFYTSPKAETRLKVTRAVDIRAEHRESEVSREASVRMAGVRCVPVTIKGELRLWNDKGEDVTVSITKDLSGELLSASLKPEVRKVTEDLNRLNPRQETIWQVPLPAGAKFYVSYVYKLYVRD